MVTALEGSIPNIKANIEFNNEDIDELDEVVSFDEDDIQDLKMTNNDNMMSIEMKITDLITSNRMIISLNSDAIANPIVTTSILASITSDIASNKQ